MKPAAAVLYGVALSAALLLSVSLSVLGMEATDNRPGTAAAGHQPTTGVYVFTEWAGQPLRVFYARPAAVNPETPVVIVMHGASRTAEAYRDAWRDIAHEQQVLVVVPEFSRADYPGRSYILGQPPAGSTGKALAPSFSAIEPLFDAVVRQEALNAISYSLFGHSGGAQFAHRFLYLHPENRAQRVVLANAGWYTLPDFDRAYPYGLGATTVTPLQLAQLLQKRVIVLLGDQDTDMQHTSLNRSAAAMQQGRHRLARGHTFYLAAAQAAKTMDTGFNWSMSLAPGVAHENEKMAQYAFPLLLHGPLSVQ